jgi:protein-tyrosine phosphatase
MDMSKKRIHFLSIFVLLAVNALLFAGRPEQAPQGRKEAPAHERHIKLEGQANFRDLGGYRTTDGRTVKWGVVYRSGQLSKLSDADLSKLKKLQIHSVIDLRGPSEVESRGKDRLPEGARGMSYPIDMTVLMKMMREEPGSPASPASSTDIMPQATRAIILYRPEVFASLIRDLAEPKNRPLLFHCTAGKDRAGVSAAIVLTLLGVPWETVREDYLLSNVYPKEEVEKELKNMRESIAKQKGIAPEQVDMSGYQAMYFVKPEYLDAAYQGVIGKYGSMETYIRESLGISDELVKQLRSELLE